MKSRLLWPLLHPSVKLNKTIDIRIYADGKTTKPILCIILDDERFYITSNIAEMIGGAGHGARLKWEQMKGTDK